MVKQDSSGNHKIDLLEKKAIVKDSVHGQERITGMKAFLLMDSIYLKLYIEPKPLKRARHSKQGSFIRTYYKDTLQEMDTLKYALINALTEQDRQVIVSHMSNANNGLKIALKLTFGFVIPKSYSKKKRNALINNPHTNNIDLDNLNKKRTSIVEWYLVVER